MSVTFTSNASVEVSHKDAPCLCAQMAESFCETFEGRWSDEARADLANSANPNCPFCKGSGVEKVEHSEAPYLNLANDNARLVLEALGLDTELWGELSIAKARRAVMRGRSRSDLTPFTREDGVVYGRPRADDDGVVQLRPVRVRSMGVDEDRMASYIERFADFVERSASLGATTITWG